MVVMVDAMNVVGASKRERIVVSRLGSREENQNQKIEVQKKKKTKKNGFVRSWN
jgi:hypothetical protein